MLTEIAADSDFNVTESLESNDLVSTKIQNWINLKIPLEWLAKKKITIKNKRGTLPDTKRKQSHMLVIRR